MTESKNQRHTDMEAAGASLIADSGAASVNRTEDIDSADLFESDAEILHLLRIIREETKDQARSDAFAALCARYRPLTEHMVSRYAASLSSSAVSSFDRQELYEEAVIALYHAARFYRAGTHATFGYFARVCIRNRLVSFLRKQKQQAQFFVIEAEADGDGHPLPYRHPDVLTVGDIGEQIVEQDAFRALFDRFLSSLTEYETNVFHRYVRGCTYKEIARALDVPLKSVDNAVYRIRVKLKQQLQESK